MTDMQTSLLLLIVRQSILNLVMHFSTQPLTSEMKCPKGYTFALRILFHFLQCRCNTCTNMINNDMIHFISSCDLIGSSILTSLALHRCIGPSVTSLCSSFTTTRSIAPMPPTCPSRLQLVHQAESCLDLLHL